MQLERAEKLSVRYDMFPTGSMVLCAVSGGVDSMCLLHLALKLGAERGFSVAAAHYNHRLRGAESDRDETFVRTWCAERGVTLFCGGCDVAAEARRARRGIEETARRLRYAFLEKVARQVGAARIATAHNADDNAETMLLHLVRGTGLQGLAGIAPRRGKLVRPLLTTPRAEIEAYACAWGVPHVEDGSNADTAYSRNKLRHTVVPLLREMNPRLIESMAETARTLREDNDYLSVQAETLAAAARPLGEDGLIFPAALAGEQSDSIAIRVVRQLLARLGEYDFSAAHLRGVVELCRSGDPSARMDLPHGLTARRVYGELVLTRSAPAALVPFSPEQGENPIPGTAWTAALSVPPWPGLVIRARGPGDEVILPHRPRKSLKKLFIDEKLPRWERAVLPVAADGQGVVAVAGFGPNTAHPRYGDGEVVFFKREREKN